MTGAEGRTADRLKLLRWAKAGDAATRRLLFTDSEFHDAEGG